MFYENVIILINNGFAVVRFCNHAFDFRPKLAYVPCKNSPATSYIIMTSARYYNLYQIILRTSAGRQVSKYVCFRSTGFYR